MAKPASKPNWTDGDAEKVTEPTVGKKLLGWIADERPSPKFMNWLFFNITEWITYFETTTDGLTALQSTYDVVVGVGGTHATLALALADVGLVGPQRVLIIDPVSITATIDINKDGWFIEWKPQALYAQSGAISPGLLVTANNVSLVNGKFIDFDGGSDVAIELDAAATNTLVNKCRFSNVDTDIQDDGTNSVLSDNINEV